MILYRLASRGRDLDKACDPRGVIDKEAKPWFWPTDTCDMTGAFSGSMGSSPVDASPYRSPTPTLLVDGLCIFHRIRTSSTD